MVTEMGDKAMKYNEKGPKEKSQGSLLKNWLAVIKQLS